MRVPQYRDYSYETKAKDLAARYLIDNPSATLSEIANATGVMREYVMLAWPELSSEGDGLPEYMRSRTPGQIRCARMMLLTMIQMRLAGARVSDIAAAVCTNTSRVRERVGCVTPNMAHGLATYRKGCRCELCMMAMLAAGSRQRARKRVK